MPKEIETKTENWEEKFLKKFPFLDEKQVIIAKEESDNKKAELLTLIMQKDLKDIRSFITTLLQTARKEAIESVLREIYKEIAIHKQLQGECIGGFVENGAKFENPHHFVIEQLELVFNKAIQLAREKFNIDL